jgi:hypothetical protein
MDGSRQVGKTSICYSFISINSQVAYRAETTMANLASEHMTRIDDVWSTACASWL